MYSWEVHVDFELLLFCTELVQSVTVWMGTILHQFFWLRSDCMGASQKSCKSRWSTWPSDRTRLPPRRNPYVKRKQRIWGKCAAICAYKDVMQCEMLDTNERYHDARIALRICILWYKICISPANRMHFRAKGLTGPPNAPHSGCTLSVIIMWRGKDFTPLHYSLGPTAAIFRSSSGHLKSDVLYLTKGFARIFEHSLQAKGRNKSGASVVGRRRQY